MYNYEQAMNTDIRNAIRKNYTPEEIALKLANRDEWEETLNNELWVDDTVTGNTTGAYTPNRYTARGYVIENLDLLSETLCSFGVDVNTTTALFLNGEWENFDVKIRCYLLGSVLSYVLDELEEEFAM
jgi:hypothetical protein